MFKRQNSVGKIRQLIGGPLAAGAPPMVQPAQWLIRPCMRRNRSFLVHETTFVIIRAGTVIP